MTTKMEPDVRYLLLFTESQPNWGLADQTVLFLRGSTPIQVLDHGRNYVKFLAVSQVSAVQEVRDALAGLSDPWTLTREQTITTTVAYRIVEDTPKEHLAPPGALCMIHGVYPEPQTVTHRGCDQYPDGTVTDVRTGKVVSYG